MKVKSPPNTFTNYYQSIATFHSYNTKQATNNNCCVILCTCLLGFQTLFQFLDFNFCVQLKTCFLCQILRFSKFVNFFVLSRFKVAVLSKFLIQHWQTKQVGYLIKWNNTVFFNRQNNTLATFESFA